MPRWSPIKSPLNRRIASLMVAMLLSACGGGESTSSAGPDPLVEDFGIAYVRQPVPEMDTADVREPATFQAGGDLIYRDLASPVAKERNITERVTGGMGDVKDVEASFDGSRLLFALRLPDIEGADPEDQPTWNLWEYEIATDTLSRVIASDIIAEEGQDVAPHYLPDNRIIFSSTRQRAAGAILIDEGKPQFAALDEDENEPAMVLHIIDEIRQNITQVSFNQSHDLDPIVLTNGEIVFSRWDNAGNSSAINLYKMNPDGSQLRLLYGAASHDTGTNGATIQFLQPRELPDGEIAVLIKPFTGNNQGGDIVAIDVNNYVENTQPTSANLGALAGPAQVSRSFGEVRTDDQPSPAGRFNTFYPLWDGTDRALITWSQCRMTDGTLILPCTDQTIADPALLEAPPLYSVYLYDFGDNTQRPVFTPQEGMFYRDVVATQPRTLPTIVFDAVPGVDVDQVLVDENVGILHIASVYDFDSQYNALGGPAADLSMLADPQQILADQRPARFLRLVKAVSLPDDTIVNLMGANFGPNRSLGMREILGYAPIEPDGSVRVKVPANVPFTISVLDKEGRRIGQRHDNWLQLRAGEVMNCSGCHDPASGMSHGNPNAFAPLNTGAPFDGYTFPNTEAAFFADAGDTMAQARTRIDPTALTPSVDIFYDDVWTDEVASGRLKDTSFSYLYADLDPVVTAPASTNCQSNWNYLCRIIINYETGIHPIWGVDRGPVDTCINCHTNADMAGADRIPDAQLDLTDGISDQNANHFKSYRELLFGDNVQELDAMGNLVDTLVQATDGNGNPLFLLDQNGNQILDVNGNPIPVMVTIPASPPMSAAGALSSPRFFNIFAPGGTHAGRLTTAELKLIAEWLDIGAQYYNNPFDVPP
ncbi:hypothetical protein DFR30_0282 [Thiogranum longum]|uniref:Hydrazine synthase alpha subunit middle domain-containing protein n=1 Tax=Thiogranum longum TaxID=1537524 RepID=A0A4R1HIM6_9GAMM|nr:hypothetical protein [Thiogranum longum]TCK17062.1 hypothetical protein DFR30_0282 [Thiogranum longum]